MWAQRAGLVSDEEYGSVRDLLEAQEHEEPPCHPPILVSDQAYFLVLRVRVSQFEVFMCKNY